MDLHDFLTTLLASAGVSAALCASLVFLARGWIAERLQQSIRHEYDQKLAHLNAQLRIESDKNALMLKSTVEREADRLKFATASISLTQQASISRRLDSLETLWAGVLAIRENIPIVMGFIDILSPDEYTSMKDHPHFRAMVGEVSSEKIAAIYKDNVGSRERIRPYVGEVTWALFAVYQAIILRTALLVQMGVDDSAKLNWHLDSGIQQLLRSAFQPNELAEFEAMRISKVGWIQRRFELRILAAMQVVISGEQFGDDALHQAERMEQKVQEFKANKV